MHSCIIDSEINLKEYIEVIGLLIKWLGCCHGRLPGPVSVQFNDLVVMLRQGDLIANSDHSHAEIGKLFVDVFNDANVQHAEDVIQKHDLGTMVEQPCNA